MVEQQKEQVSRSVICWIILRGLCCDNGLVNFLVLGFHQAFEEWKAARREELSEYQKQIGEQYLANVEKDLERWQNVRNRKANNDMLNLQETMDKELDTHRLEHGPKKRKVPSGSNDEAEEEDDDVEDINAGEDDMMDDVLDVDDNSRIADETTRTDAADVSPNNEKTD